MVIFFRSILFSLFLPLWTFCIGTIGIPTLFFPVRGPLFIGHYWSKGVIAALHYIVGITYRIEGSLPKGPILLASKHQSAWDTIIFLALFPNPCYITKKQLLRLPVYGQYLPAMGMIPIDRKGGASQLKSLLKLAKKRLQQGRPIVIFPEGTRKLPGAPTDYQPGIVALYKGLDAKVIPVAVNSGLLWRKGQFLKKPGCITMRYLEPIPPGLDKKSFMQELENNIETASAELAKLPAVK